MQIVIGQMTQKELENLSVATFGYMIKAVVDVSKEIVAIDAELHADLERFLLEEGSNQEDLWGINLFHASIGTPEFVEFDSMINIRPHQNNFGRNVQSIEVRNQIQNIVSKHFRK